MDEEPGSKGGGGGGMVVTHFEGSLEPIKSGNFYDMKRASQPSSLVGCGTRLCLRLSTLMRPIALPSFFLLF